MPLDEYDCMPYGEFVDLVICDRIMAGVIREEVTDDEEMIPKELI